MNLQDQLINQGLMVPYSTDTTCLKEPLLLYEKKVGTKPKRLRSHFFTLQI